MKYKTKTSYFINLKTSEKRSRRQDLDVSSDPLVIKTSEHRGSYVLKDKLFVLFSKTSR